MIGKILSYIVSIAVTFIISKFGQKLVWHNKKEDGTSKSPWAPSPKGLSMLTGGYHEFIQDTYHALTRWSKQVGDLYSVRLGFKRVVVLNSAELVHKVLIEKEQLNSTRQPSDTFEKMQTDQCKTVYSAPFEAYWSRLRRATYIVVGKMYAPQFGKLFKEQAKRLIFGINNAGSDALTPKQLRQLVDLVAMDTALSIVYGSDQQHDPVAMLALQNNLEALEARQTRKYNRMGQFFSFINNWLDIKSLFTLDSCNMELRNAILDTVYPWFSKVYAIRGDGAPLSEQEKKELKLTGDKKLDSIAKSLLNIEPSKYDPEPQQLTKDEILVNTVHMTLHAYTYLSSALYTLIQRLASELELQARLHQQGTAEEALELANAFVNESLRFDPPNTILSYAARTDYDLDVEDDKLYRVDVSSELVVNVHAIHHDSRYYPNPERFDPDRFLKSKTTPLLQPSGKNTTASDHLAFGAGRRICIGAKASIDMLSAVLLQVVKNYELKGGDVKEKVEHATSVWSWVGRTETQGASIEFIKR